MEKEIRKDFKTSKDKIVKFVVNVDDIILELSDDNIKEARSRGRAESWDDDVFENGVDIKDTLTIDQKLLVLEELNKLSKRDYNYCKENHIIFVHGHIRKKKPRVLIDRGFPTDLEELALVISHVICSAEHVSKAKVTFNKTNNGISNKYLQYTIQGKYNGDLKNIAIRFTRSTNPVIAVTVLPTHE